MAAEDYLLQAVTGALEGAAGVYVPRKLKQLELQDEFGLYQAKQSLERGKFEREQKFKTDEAIRAESAKPRKMYQTVDYETGKELAPPSEIQPVPVGKDPAKGKEVGLEALTKETADQLNKLRPTANSNLTNIQTINKALGLVDKGVTGKGGELKSLLAPYAEFAGANVENLNDAQSYQLLTRLIVGPMRAEIIGPGPVSEWEQKLLQQISGGGSTAKGAARELLNTYKKLAKNKVIEYNDTAIGSYSLSPRFRELHKPINIADDYVDPSLSPKLGAPANVSPAKPAFKSADDILKHYLK